MAYIDLESIYGLENIRDTFFSAYDKGIPVVLYGSGKGAIQALELFIKYKIKPVAICDSNKEKHGQNYRGIPVISIEDALKKYKDFYVFVSAPTYARKIIDFLKSYVKEERILFFNDFDQQEEHREFMYENREFLENLYERLEDDLSRITLKEMLKGWVSCDNRYFYDICREEQYFCKDIVEFHEQEVFVDAGAFTGDTIEEFIQLVDKNYKKIYALEPNAVCFEELDKLEMRYPKVKVVHKGAFNVEGTYGFNNVDAISQSSAYLSNESESVFKVEVDLIDNIVNEPITFVKMDIEGSEVMALEGAKNSITKSRPKLAICVYHKFEDIVEIPKFIMNLDLNYKYYLRHHSYYTGETVFYAV
ncbi:MAG: FkbM family methyltransferase [Marinisporobacter sp.]|nr:FkbM family methyltransferase [Marinisporobacter sp.]